jgi:hypothetical protein
MQRRLILVRHGRSAHLHGGAWYDIEGLRRWMVGYDEAGIREGDAPPAALKSQASHADLIIASDMARAMQSAQRLAAGRTVEVSPLLRETPLEIPRWVPVRLPMLLWDALIHTQWFVRLLRHAHASPEELERAEAAALWLTTRSEGRALTIVLTHGVFRRLVAARLLEHGWRPGRGRRSYKHWSVWEFRRRE